MKGTEIQVQRVLGCRKRAGDDGLSRASDDKRGAEGPVFGARCDPCVRDKLEKRRRCWGRGSFLFVLFSFSFVCF